MTNLLAIIARAGSKGLPNKAMVPLMGKPLIAWTLEHALGSKQAHAMTLSSDGQDILDVGRRMGVEIFERPSDLASDQATIDSAVRDQVLKWENLHRTRCDNVVILYGNIPLRPADLTDRALHKLMDTGCDSVQSVHGVGKVHPYWMKKLGGVSGDELLMYQNNDVFRRQDLPVVYMLDGGIIAVTRESLFNFDPTGHRPHQFLGTKRRAIITQPGDVVDVDDALDLAFAEAVLRTRAAATSPASRVA
jgi:CMP-N-acetylneuraminic acid synthetase